MSEFLYRARDQRGRLVTGQIDADSDKVVKNLIADQGLIPLTVKKTSPSFVSLPNWKELFIQVKLEDLIVFTRQFYTLFKSGMNMDKIFQTLGKQVGNKYLKEAIEVIRNDVASGGTLGAAFGKHPKVFPQVYSSLLTAGEQAGI